MKVLSEMPTDFGGKYVLVDYGNDFFGYGYNTEMHTLCGFPVNQCGTKEEVLLHCESIIELCKKYIVEFNNKLAKEKSNPKGWKLLIEHEELQLEALTEFKTILLKKG